MDNLTAGIIIRALLDSDTPAVRDAGKDIVTELLRRHRLVATNKPFRTDNSNEVYYRNHIGLKVWLDWKDES